MRRLRKSQYLPKHNCGKTNASPYKLHHMVWFQSGGHFINMTARYYRKLYWMLTECAPFCFISFSWKQLQTWTTLFAAFRVLVQAASESPILPMRSFDSDTGAASIICFNTIMKIIPVVIQIPWFPSLFERITQNNLKLMSDHFYDLVITGISIIEYFLFLHI